MTRLKRSRCIQWRLGWLPSYNTTRCLRHTSQLLTKQHAIYCLDMHHRLQIPKSITDPLSLLLNKLPTRRPHSFQTKSFWTIRWPVICAILHELDHIYHGKESPSPSDPGQKLIKWLFNSS
ncbi:uncharacterized protein RHIMIDRAFT_103136 [Rhizopus microsporus ATCC 52813]|uniref:Uncharacterized protein n=1 Tax=Rhizopus microsporus ATCC 52813 TaxID=1340429 RepID=A0A2G4T0M1_RHIZD|nr:uncharacterized protein RHIMIDRAFT_103136 [Rhizopus microsporus ATCC 52813]PHZ14573.1 hypothetical protein RHIMIDRAFT_103136 [Rhizopus microsporus ATCC 52813]